MNVCIDCGVDYIYDPNNALGASSSRCTKCRKKDSKINKIIRLFEIAGDRCIKCGYSGSIHALSLFNAIDPLSKPVTQEQLEAQAKKQFVLCLNCKAEIENKVYEMQVISSSPIKVEFYYRQVRVELTKISTYINQSDDVEIVDKTPEDLKKV